MQARRAKDLLNTMSPDECLAFDRWWRQKQTSNTPFAYQLFCLLKHPKHKHKSEERLWKKIHRDTPYEPGLMRKYYSQILKELTTFLPIHLLQEDEAAQELYLLNTYNNRRLPALYASKYNKARTRLEAKEKTGFDSDDYYHAYRLAVEQQHHLVLTRAKVGKRNLGEISKSLDQWWIIQRLIISCSNLSAKQMRNIQGEDALLPLLLPGIDRSPELMRVPLLSAYRTLYGYLSGEPGFEMEQLLAVIDTHKKQISASELSTVFILLVNALIPHLNQEGLDSRFLDAIAAAYSWGLAEGLLAHNGTMIPQHFKNYISIFLKQGKTKEVQSFLAQYGPALPPAHREAFCALGQAQIDFRKGNFRAVKQQLRTHTFARIEHEITARLLLFQSEYELVYGTDRWEEERESLVDSLINFRQRVGRQRELSSKHKKPFLSRIEVFQKLVKANQKATLLALEADIHTRDSLDDGTWLLAKVKQRLARED